MLTANASLNRSVNAQVFQCRMALVNQPRARQPGQHALSENSIRWHCDVFIGDCAQASHANIQGICSLIDVGTECFNVVCHS